MSLDDVRLWLVEFARAYGHATVLYDPSQAYLLVEQLRQAGVGCREFTFTASSVGKLAQALVSSLRSRLIALPCDEMLRDELLSVRLREGSTPGVLRLDHAAGRHDDQAVVLGMAVVELTQRGSGDWSAVYGVTVECSRCGRLYLTGAGTGRLAGAACPFCGQKPAPGAVDVEAEPALIPAASAAVEGGLEWELRRRGVWRER